MPSNDLFGFFTGNRGVPRKKKRSTVKHDAVDEGVLQDITNNAELYAKARQNAPSVDIDGKQKEVESWQTLVDDTFLLHHTNEDSAVEAPEEIVPSLEPARRIMQRYMGTEDFKAIKADTTHDEVASAFAAMRARTELEKLAGGEMEAMHQQAQEAKKAENRIERNEEALEGLREQARQMHQQGDPITQDLKDQIGQASNRKTNARHDLAKVQEQMANTPVTVGANHVISAAAKAAKEGVECVRNLPGMGKGEGAGSTQKLTADEALRLANLFAENPNLFEIAKKLGRIVRDMKSRRARRMVGGVEEVVDIALGRNLPQVLPAQLMYMRHPLLKRWFLRRYMQSALLERERRGTTEAGRGPVVLVVDESYSMQGQPFTWAKAVCMAVMAIARKERRDCAVVSYASGGQLESWEFPHRERMDPNKVVDMAGHFFGGGTTTREGMDRARKIIAKDERFTRADVVLISDGQDYFQEEDAKVREDLRERGIRLQGIQIGGGASSYITEMCEHHSNAMDLTGANDATDMLAEHIN